MDHNIYSGQISSFKCLQRAPLQIFIKARKFQSNIVLQVSNFYDFLISTLFFKQSKGNNFKWYDLGCQFMSPSLQIYQLKHLGRNSLMFILCVTHSAILLKCIFINVQVTKNWNNSLKHASLPLKALSFVFSSIIFRKSLPLL